MKILFLPNWKVEYCTNKPSDKQPPDYYVKGQDYWFFRYFEDKPEVDVLDISSTKWLESFEKSRIKFYIWQALRAIPKLNKYDIVISHGMQSGVVVSLWRKILKTRCKHVVFDIGSFNSAAESGGALKLMQLASNSIDGIIYHTSSQKEYYQKFFPWLVDRSRFIRFGTDADFFATDENENLSVEEKEKYCICVGYAKRDWDTVSEAFKMAGCTDLELRMIGHVEDKFKGIPGINQIERVPIKELIEQIKHASFGILPLKSFNYSYGQMTLMQQMALGKTVIASKVPSLVDYVEDMKTAVLYEPENVKELSQKIKMLVLDDKLRNEIGSNAKDFIHDTCNETIMAKEIEGFLKSLL